MPAPKNSTPQASSPQPAQANMPGPRTVYQGTINPNGGIVYAPYIPLHQTANHTNDYTIRYNVQILTENIPDFRQRFPRGLTLTPMVYQKILDRLNTDWYKKAYTHINFKELVREKCAVFVNVPKWETYPFYHHLWNAQGHGPFNFDANDCLYFSGAFKIYPVEAKALDCFKKHYTIGKNNIQVKLHGTLSINHQHEITDLCPQTLSWWENGDKIA